MPGILLLGVNGQLGHELRRCLTHPDGVVALSSAELDLRRADEIRRLVRTVAPAIIVNAAAYTAVDSAESEPDVAMAVNAEAPRILAEEAARLGGAIVHYSTDFVFDGRKDGAYVETDGTHPLNVYGESKRRGEEALAATGAPHVIFRTSWVYAARGRNFLLTMEKLLRERSEVRVVADQFGAPTWAGSLAEATCRILEARDLPVEYLAARSGIYHITCSGQTSWHGFAEAIRDDLRAKGDRVAKLVAIPASEYPTPAARPKNSVLDNHKLRRTFGVQLESWQAAFQSCLMARSG